MNILLISSRYYPVFNKDNRGAIEKLVRIYLKYNENTDDHFTIYSPKIAADNFDNPELKNSEFRIVDKTTVRYKVAQYYHALKRRILRRPNSELYIKIIARDIIRRGEQNKYDLIIFENGEQDIPVFKRITKTNTRIALHLHNDYLNQDTKNSKIIMDSVDEVWAVSGFIARRVDKIKRNKTLVIANAIDFEGAKTDEKLIKRLARKYDVEKNKVFIFVGRILRVKGILQLVEAFDKYNIDEPNSKLLIVGSTENGFEGIMLRRALKKACMENCNIIHLGYLRPDELVNYEAISDCQIIPSMWEEAFGLVVLEAMYANLKIIASRSGGIPEVGGDRITYVNREQIVTELIDSMKKIKKDDKLPDRYYGKQLKKYTIKKYCQNFYGAIHER